MAKPINAKKIYENLKKNGTKFVEEIHCPLVIEMFNKHGTVSSFCKEVGISDSTFYRWANRNPIFSECYRIGYMIARENWEEEGRSGQEDEYFNIDYWKVIGAARFGVGRTNRVRVDMGADSSPYEQYQNLITQASFGDYTASEIKQLMESINVGVRVYESFKLQAEVDKMKDDLIKMSQNNGNNIVPIESIKKTN